MKITKKQLKRIIAEERSRLQRKEVKDFGSNAARQAQLKEVEYHGDPATVAFKNLSSVISAAEQQINSRQDVYMLVDTIKEEVNKLLSLVEDMEASAERGEYS